MHCQGWPQITGGGFGEYETAGGFPRKASAIGDCPTIQLAHHGTISKSGEGEVRGHHQEFTFSRHLEEEIRVFGAEVGELLIGHGLDR